MSQVRTPEAATVPLPLRSVLPAFGLDVGIAMALSVSIMMAGLFGWAAWRGIQLAHGSTATFFEGMVTNTASLIILALMFLTGVVSNPKIMGAIRGLFGKKTS